MKIILLSGKAGSGKDEFFNYFSSKNSAFRVSFSDPIKILGKELFGWNGLKNESGRDLLINIGQIMRDDIFAIEESKLYDINKKEIIENRYVCNNYSLSEIYSTLVNKFTPDKNFWSDIALKKINRIHQSHDYIVVTDLRFKNEYLYLKMFFNDLITVRINRKSSFINDISETDMDDFKNFNYIINNYGNLDDFHNKIQDFMKDVLNV